MDTGESSTPSPEDRSLAVGWMIGLTALGMAIRLAFLLVAGDLEPHGDESNYIYLASCWNRFSFYSDAAFYLWPPGYPYVLATGLDWFGVGGIYAVKVLQVLLSGVVGWVTMLLAHRVFGRRAALSAGTIWCFYLPLIGFTHYLWPETLYLAVLLPSVYLLLTWWQRARRGRLRHRRLLVAGLLFGVALLIKEVAFYLCPMLAAAIAWRGGRLSPGQRVSSAVLFLLAVTVVVLPWTLRNYEVYTRFVPVGSTLGKLAYMGLNNRYYNLDYPAKYRSRIAQANERMRQVLVTTDLPQWKPENENHVIDRSKQAARQGLAFARGNPAFTLRCRIKRMADWVSPVSFFMRHYGLRLYHGVLAEPAVRRPLLLAAVALPILVLAASLPGLFWSLRDPGGRVLFGLILAYFVVVAGPLQGMSRYRAPIEPLLMVLASGFAAGRGRPWLSRRNAILAVLATAATLAGLWWVNCREVVEYLRILW